MTAPDGKAPGDDRLPPGEPHDLAGLVEYVAGSVVSRTIRKGKSGTVTLFAFAAGQELSEHTAPFDAFVLGVEGRVGLSIGGRPSDVGSGQIALMPAGVPHAVQAAENCKFMLIMIKEA